MGLGKWIAIKFRKIFVNGFDTYVQVYSLVEHRDARASVVML